MLTAEPRLRQNCYDTSLLIHQESSGGTEPAARGFADQHGGSVQRLDDIPAQLVLAPDGPASTTDAQDDADFAGRVRKTIFTWANIPRRIDPRDIPRILREVEAATVTKAMAGAAGGAEHSVAVPMWTVTDIDAAVARVLEAGGSVIEAPSRQPYGMMAHCADDQGARFYLGAF